MIELIKCLVRNRIDISTQPWGTLLSVPTANRRPVVLGGPIGGALLRCLEGRGNSDLDDGGWAQLIELARQQRVAAFLFETISPGRQGTALPAAALTELRDEARRLGVRSLAIQRDLAAILAAFGTASIPAVLLKGAHLARHIYRHAGLREMNDLDLLIRPADVERARQVMESLGYAFTAPVPTSLAGSHHLPRLVKRGAISVEVHVAILPVSVGLDIEIDGIWRRAAPLEPGSPHFVLSPEDLLLHICAHSAYGHAAEFGLRPLCDVAQIARAFPALDWSAVCVRAREWRAARGTFMTLHLAVEYLGADVPPWVLAALRPADFDSELAAIMRAHLFTSKPLSKSVSPEATRTYALSGTSQRLAHIMGRVFVPRATLVSLYPAAERSRILPWYYAKRAVSLIRRYSWLATSAPDQDSELGGLIARRNRLLEWLNDGAAD